MGFEIKRNAPVVVTFGRHPIDNSMPPALNVCNSLSTRRRKAGISSWKRIRFRGVGMRLFYRCSFPITLFGLMALVLAPKKGLAEPTIDFDRDVQPILATHCLHCHGPDAGSRKGDLRLDQEADALAPRDGYRIIDRENPAASVLLKRLRHPDLEERMPPASEPNALTETNIATLEAWIAQGAPWAEHWAFVRPERPAVPESASHPIDHFIRKRLAWEEIQPSPEANRVTLIRRASFTMTGLPPSIAAVDSFLADKEPGAYERVIDRLLDSPRYGEHMALEWLDAARYADSSGYQADWERHMWPWRDWVVAAYNANMPFDQFTVEQLAGDMLPEPTQAQLIATGFNRNHRINDEGGSLDAEFEVEYVVDRVDTTATVWLGLSAGCARCHDHKYDPISQREYYQLFAYFNRVPEKGIDGRKGAAKPFIEVPFQRVVDRLEGLRQDLAELEKQRPSDKDAINKLKEKIKKLEPMAKTPVQIMQEQVGRRPTYLLQRGDYRTPDKSEEIHPALPAMFEGSAKDRLALARWLVSDANPLTARVIVNRLWQRHFGTGLVASSEDFGTRGDRPSHPELLDWLATEFVRSGWDLKAVHKLILTSATFRQSSHFRPTLAAQDPHNRLLARGPRLRLSGAAIRDHALFVSGLLSDTMGGPPVKPYQPEGLWGEVSFGTGKTTIDFYVQDHGEDLYRRSLYTFWKRTVAPPMLSLFDGGSRAMCRVRSETTNTPMQALNLQNDTTFVEAARHLAERMLMQDGDDLAKIRHGWRLALVREPESRESQVLALSLAKYRTVYESDEEAAKALLATGESSRDKTLAPAEHAAWTMIAQTILNLDETITQP